MRYFGVSHPEYHHAQCAFQATCFQVTHLPYLTVCILTPKMADHGWLQPHVASVIMSVEEVNMRTWCRNIFQMVVIWPKEQLFLLCGTSLIHATKQSQLMKKWKLQVYYSLANCLPLCSFITGVLLQYFLQYNDRTDNSKGLTANRPTIYHPSNPLTKCLQILTASACNVLTRRKQIFFRAHP